MPNRLATKLVLLVLLTVAGHGHAAEGDNTKPSEDETRRPEHRARPLPADTFKPSEEISEDFPVPFPVDI